MIMIDRKTAVNVEWKGRNRMKETRWAIVGTGYIANEFAKGMQEAAAAELVAVVSRSEENGKTEVLESL